MQKKHRNRKRDRNKTRAAHHQSQPNEIIVTPIGGSMEPLDVIFYRPGRCAMCQHKADDLMIGITWIGQGGKENFACYFCLDCVLFKMAAMTELSSVATSIEALSLIWRASWRRKPSGRGRDDESKTIQPYSVGYRPFRA